MTNAQIRTIHEQHGTLLQRLDAGDGLHMEAAAEIRRLREEIREARKDARDDSRAAYSEGCWDTRERHGSDESW